MLTLALSFALVVPVEVTHTDYEEARNATVDAKGATAINVIARSGTLTIRGIEGRTDVRVRGTARASQEDWLQDIRLIAERRGNTVVIEVRIPNRSCHGMCWGDYTQALDLEIEVPKGIIADVEDSSGELEIRDVGDLDLEDSSGDLELEDISGRVRLQDSSGEIRILRVAGDVEIEDNSGAMKIRAVKGSVMVRDDSSGDIDVTDVTGTVRVRNDGSGSIYVRDVGGDFIVDHDGSGEISSRGVKGKTDVPEPRRSRRSRDRDI